MRVIWADWLGSVWVESQSQKGPNEIRALCMSVPLLSVLTVKGLIEVGAAVVRKEPPQSYRALLWLGLDQHRSNGNRWRKRLSVYLSIYLSIYLSVYLSGFNVLVVEGVKMEAGTSSFILGLLLYLDPLDSSWNKGPILLWLRFIWTYMNTTIVLWCSSIPFEPFGRFVWTQTNPATTTNSLDIWAKKCLIDMDSIHLVTLCITVIMLAWLRQTNSPASIGLTWNGEFRASPAVGSRHLEC